MKTLTYLIVALLLLIVSAPGQEMPAEITTDDFSRTRDLTNVSDINLKDTTFVFPKPAYKLKRVKKAKNISSRPKVPSGTKPAVKFQLPADSTAVEVWKRIGVTLWRLPVGQGGGDIRRAAAETVFSEGDQVRMSFESPEAGYIYIVDREIYADGTVGSPLLVFPTLSSRSGNNRVEAGQVVDVPAQTDRVPFFKLESSKPNWRGELITVILSPVPLKDILIPPAISPLTPSLIEEIEARYMRDVGEYEQEKTVGAIQTTAEKVVGTRELTQKDPFPQTMLRAKVRPKEPMVISLNLSVKR